MTSSSHNYNLYISLGKREYKYMLHVLVVDHLRDNGLFWWWTTEYELNCKRLNYFLTFTRSYSCARLFALFTDTCVEFCRQVFAKHGTTHETNHCGLQAHISCTCSHDGAVLGRCVTDLKVSASPRRDRTNDELEGCRWRSP